MWRLEVLFLFILQQQALQNQQVQIQSQGGNQQKSVQQQAAHLQQVQAQAAQMHRFNALRQSQQIMQPSALRRAAPVSTKPRSVSISALSH